MSLWAQPLSPDKVVLDDEYFRYAHIMRDGYRVRENQAPTSLERAIVANHPNRRDQVVVCQCNGTAEKVDACMMGLRFKEVHMEESVGTADYTFTVKSPGSVFPCVPDAPSLDIVRVQCNRRAEGILLDFQGVPDAQK